jgi:hypothetical protein
MKRKLTVVEFEIYTDGDFHFNKDFLLNHTSRYFDQEFYEYTKTGDYEYSARRVFDRSEDAVDFVNKIKDSCSCSVDWRKYIIEHIDEIVNDVLQDYWAYNSGYRDYDGNQTIILSICDVETDVKKIKHIEYEEN